MQELAVAAKGFHDATDVRVVRDVAACSAGHQNLDAEFAILFQQQRAFAKLSRRRSRHQASGAASDDDDIPGLFGVRHDGLGCCLEWMTANRLTASRRRLCD